MSLHERLRATMKIQGRSQEQLAKAIGVSQGAVSRWVTGEVEPKASELIRVAKYLRVLPGFLAEDSYGEITEDSVFMCQIFCKMLGDLGIEGVYNRLMLLGPPQLLRAISQTPSHVVAKPLRENGGAD